METRELGISILFLAVLASGCIGPGGNQQTQKENGRALTITGPEVQPSSGSIYPDSTVRVSIGVKNTGEMNGTLMAGEDGEEILTNYCTDIFKMQDYDGRSSKTEANKDSYFLKPGWEAEFDWELKQYGDVPLMGQTCNLQFQAPFNYSVSAYREIQIKKGIESGGDPALSSKTSKGPLSIQIETIGSSSDQGAPVFIEGDNIEMLTRLSKRSTEESPYRGLVSVTTPEFSSSEGLNIQMDTCNIPERLIMDRGDSQVIRCDISYGGSIDSPSVREELSVEADYQYTKDAGSIPVEVKYSGNN
ncbi:hypothetical protein [Candidatus Nanohalovita haloferacivicina]|uniref:hypothetical protein n=1 Tax=Candidatus Nanohalovita haloferacivicina TaxID=2978046 RepID=UPI00325FD3D6|nr:hypothetical protein HBNXNv_1105 [Candidatus Nanohalobia archaeon BNXNv]